ncbi:MAG: phenylalanine--tRNA ligase subunit alpha [Dehalococcoidia bacterium]|nr:phenylalanine--tRNA ligase subunit alpha [Dehalococcoidia bacterium]
MVATPSPQRVSELEREARAALAASADEAALERWRTATLGRSGTLTQLLRSLGTLDATARREVGAAANTLKNALEAALEARREQLRAAALAADVHAGTLDVTLPGRPRRRGALHPVTQTLREILAAFTRMGFDTVEGPEVELDEYNFERLRIPADHPARDMWDTFWLDEGEGAARLLLRTHTSPMQIRYMDAHQPPIRIAVPGRCYRYEATDATHEWMMQQVELLVVDEGVSMADLKGTLQEFARALFGPERRVMMRNSYFPFVEPGVELAVDCFVCDGPPRPDCSVCRGSGWIEIMGAGMVHPEMIARAGYDAQRYTGFAAGMGVERIAMLKYGVDDIRHFYANDLRFLRQF